MLAIPTARAVLLTCVLGCVLWPACGYSEAEMQDQRDKLAALTHSLDTLAADQLAYRARLAELNAALSKCQPAPVTP
jgi:hypothetical protein